MRPPKIRMAYNGSGKLEYLGKRIDRMDGTFLYNISKLIWDGTTLTDVYDPQQARWEDRDDLDW